LFGSGVNRPHVSEAKLGEERVALGERFGKQPTVSTSTMRRVILESPYNGDTDGNVTYARACVRDSLLCGEAPIASHLLYTQPGVLRDSVAGEREQGIAPGLAWGPVAEAMVVYIDRGSHQA
jgi:hypothetical protein